MSERTSDFDRLGGDSGVRAIISRFVDQVRADMMIGYLFRNVDLDQLKDREATFAGQHLGAAAPYTGRPLRTAHAPHRIRGGQFDRRMVILRDTLRAFGVPSDIEERWLESNRALRASITLDDSGQCAP